MFTSIHAKGLMTIMASSFAMPCILYPDIAQGQAARGPLEEIVVSARRREERLQEIPISVSAFSTDQFEMRNIRTTEDLNVLVPGLSVIGGGATGTADGNFAVRGIPGVATYVDGIWQVTGDGLLALNVVEMERIEIVRGPQGTLFGKNALGGAIQYVTKRPDDVFAARTDITVGIDNRRDVVATADIPLFDGKILTKWTAAHLETDGFIKSLTTGNRFGDIDDTIFRGDIIIRPTNNFDIRVVAEATNIDRNGLPFVLESLDESRRGPQTFIQATPSIAFTNENLSFDGGGVGKFENRSELLTNGWVQEIERWTVDMNWTVNEWLNVRSLSGLRLLTSKIVTDFDGTEFNLISDDRRRDQEQFTQEVQAFGNVGTMADFVFGFFYWAEEQEQRQFRFTFREFRIGELENTGGFPLVPPNSGQLDGTRTDGRAFFGEVNFHVGDIVSGIGGRADFLNPLTLTFGARLNNEDFEAFTKIPDVPMPELPFEDVAGNVLAGEVEFLDKTGFDSFTPRFSIQYQWTPDIMTYASRAKGFDSGGLDTNAREVPGVGIVSFEPQIFRQNEFGIRTEWFNGRVRINGSYFHGKWKNIQVSESPPDPDNPGDFLPDPITVNVAKARVDGFEVETLFQMTDFWQFDGNLGFINPRFTEAGRSTQITVDTPFAQAPKWSFSLGSQYTLAMAELGAPNAGSITARVDWGWIDDHLIAREERRQSIQESFGLLSARISYLTQDERVEFVLHGTNLTNQRYINGGFVSGGFGFEFATLGQKRQVGATLRIRFGG